MADAAGKGGREYSFDEHDQMLRAPRSDNVEHMIRSGFIRKVYGILSVQLIITFGLIFLAVFVQPVKERLCGVQPGDCDVCMATGYKISYAIYNVSEDAAAGYDDAPMPNECVLGLHKFGGCNLHRGGGCVVPTQLLHTALILSIVGAVAFIIPLLCCPQVSQRVPTNYLMLFGFTVCEAASLSVVCLFYNTLAVGLAVAMTALVTLGLSLFACFTKIDFTGMGIYLYGALLSLIMFGFVSSIFAMFYRVAILQTLYAGAGCLIFSLYIIFDTQLIVGGQHRQVRLDEDYYIFAALNIYIDIVNLFLMLLELLNDR